MNNPTIKDVAREAGVSTASVSRVLNKNGYTSNSMQEQVLSAAKKINYSVNDIAKSLKTNRTNTIGVLIPDISNPFFMRIAKGLEDAIKDTSYNLIFTSGSEDPKKEEKLLQLLIEKRVDGIILATAGLHKELLNNIILSKIPLVLVDRKIEGLINKCDYVVEDNFEGAYQLTKKLVDKGYSDIGLIAGILDVSTGIERLKGFESLMAERNITINPEYVFHGDYSEKSGEMAVKYFSKLSKPPTAILSLNNTMTVGVIKELLKNHSQNKEMFTIASYGYIELQEYIEKLQIYSVKQTPYKIGRTAGDLLLNRLLLEESQDSLPKNIYLPVNYNFKL